MQCSCFAIPFQNMVCVKHSIDWSLKWITILNYNVFSITLFFQNCAQNCRANESKRMIHKKHFLKYTNRRRQTVATNRTENTNKKIHLRLHIFLTCEQRDRDWVSVSVPVCCINDRIVYSKRHQQRRWQQQQRSHSSWRMDNGSNENAAKMDLTWIPFNSFSQMALINRQNDTRINLGFNACRQRPKGSKCIWMKDLSTVFMRWLHSLSPPLAAFVHVCFASRPCEFLCVYHFFLFIYPFLVVRLRVIFRWLFEFLLRLCIEQHWYVVSVVCFGFRVVGVRYCCWCCRCFFFCCSHVAFSFDFNSALELLAMH